MVPTIVVAAAIVGMITIVPVAMADRDDDDDDDDDEYTCKKWFFKAFKEYNKKGFVPAGIKDKVRECIADGHKSHWELPDMDENPQPPILTGLEVEFVESKINVPISTQDHIQEIFPCPTGEVVIGDMEILSVSTNTRFTLELQNDKTTLVVKTKNFGANDDTLVLMAPCLGLVGT